MIPKIINYDVIEFDLKLYDQVLELWNNSEGITVLKCDSPEELKVYLDRNPKLNFIVLDNDKVIATILAGHDGRRGFINHLAVHPDYRKNGIAKYLIDLVIKNLKEQKIRKCHLFVLSDNDEGIEFWKKVGWDYRTDVITFSMFTGL